jgi:hypothetical protein
MLKLMFFGAMVFTLLGDGPARDLEEIEARPDWLGIYPPGYARLLGRYGVPTIAGTDVDVFNRRLIEVLPPDCLRQVCPTVGRPRVPCRSRRQPQRGGAGRRVSRKKWKMAK